MPQGSDRQGGDILDALKERGILKVSQIMAEGVLKTSVNIYRMVIYRMDNLEFEVFGIVFVCHELGDDALKEFFVDAAGGDMVDNCFHALHEAIGMPIIAIMHKKPDTYGQCHSLIGILEIMASA